MFLRSLVLILTLVFSFNFYADGNNGIDKKIKVKKEEIAKLKENNLSHIYVVQVAKLEEEIRQLEIEKKFEKDFHALRQEAEDNIEKGKLGKAQRIINYSIEKKITRNGKNIVDYDEEGYEPLIATAAKANYETKGEANSFLGFITDNSNDKDSLFEKKYKKAKTNLYKKPSELARNNFAKSFLEKKETELKGAGRNLAKNKNLDKNEIKLENKDYWDWDTSLDKKTRGYSLPNYWDTSLGFKSNSSNQKNYENIKRPNGQKVSKTEKKSGKNLEASDFTPVRLNKNENCSNCSDCKKNQCCNQVFFVPEKGNVKNREEDRKCNFFKKKYIADVIDRGFQEYFTLDGNKIHRIENNGKVTPDHIWKNLAIRSCYFFENNNCKSLYKSPYSIRKTDLVNDITYSILVDEDMKKSFEDKEDKFKTLQESSLGNAYNNLGKEKKIKCTNKEGLENLKEILLINEEKLRFKFECELEGKKYNYDKDVKINFKSQKSAVSSNDVSLSDLLLNKKDLKSTDLLEAVSFVKAENENLQFIELKNYGFGLIFNSYTKLPHLVLKGDAKYKIQKEPLRPKVVKENEVITDSTNIKTYCKDVMNNEGFDINLFYAKSFLGNMPFELELDEEKALPSTKLTEEIRKSCLTLSLNYGSTKYKDYFKDLSKDLKKMSDLIAKAKRKEESRKSVESDIKISLDDLKKVKSFYDFMEKIGLTNPEDTTANNSFNFLLSNLYADDNYKIDKLFEDSIVTKTDLKRQLQNVNKMEDFLKKFSDKDVLKHPENDFYTRSTLALINRNAANYISPKPSGNVSGTNASGSTSASGSDSGNFWETAGKIGAGLVTATPVLATGFMSVWGMFQEVKAQQRQYDMELLKLQMDANPCFSMKYEVKEKEKSDKMLGIKYKYDSVEYVERSDYNVKMDNMFNPLTGQMESLSPYEMCVLNAIAGKNQNPFMKCYQMASMKAMGGPIRNIDISNCFRAAAGLEPLKGPDALKYNSPTAAKAPEKGGDGEKEEDEDGDDDGGGDSPKAAGGGTGAGTTRKSAEGGSGNDREIEGMLSPSRFSRGYGGYGSNSKGSYPNYKPGTASTDAKGSSSVVKDLGEIQVNTLGIQTQLNNQRTTIYNSGL